MYGKNDNMTWTSNHQESAITIPDDGTTTRVPKESGAMDMEATVSEDDETALLNSISSLSLLSSHTTLHEHSYNASLAASTRSRNKEAVFSYKLKPNDLECLGYLQFQAHVSSLPEIPTELAMVSGKSIVYVVVDADHNSAVTGDVFSHPLFNEAMESLFIPVSVIPVNKDQGNMCVSHVGFLDESGQNIVPPLCCNGLSKTVLGNAMVAALQAKQQAIAAYLVELLREEASFSLDASKRLPEFRRAWFGLQPENVALFEAALSQQPGVVSFQFGWRTDREPATVMAEVHFNAKLTSYGSLVRFALTVGSPSQSDYTSITTGIVCQSNDERMAARLEVAKLAKQDSNDMSDEDDEPSAVHNVSIECIGDGSGTLCLEPHHSFGALRATPLRFVPMTKRQAILADGKVACGRFDEAVQLLSPRQGLILLEATRKGALKFCDVLGLPILEAWQSASDRVVPIASKKQRPDVEQWATGSF